MATFKIYNNKITILKMLGTQTMVSHFLEEITKAPVPLCTWQKSKRQSGWTEGRTPVFSAFHLVVFSKFSTKSTHYCSSKKRVVPVGRPSLGG